jgi:tetratricopeptide (TPR) repeat protein
VSLGFEYDRGVKLLGRIVAGLIAAALSSPVMAQRSSDWQACVKSQSAPDAGIRACTNIINSGREKGRNLAIAYNNRGDAFWVKNDNDKAFADYDQAIKIDPKYATAYVNRGIIHRRLGLDD